MDVATATLLPSEHGDLTSDLLFKRPCPMEHNWVRASQGTCQHSGPYKHGVQHILIQHTVWGGYPCLFMPQAVQLFSSGCFICLPLLDFPGEQG